MAAVNDTCNCFNCMLTDNKCLQFGQCSHANGKCICPLGWGNDDCKAPLCGGLDVPLNDRNPLQIPPGTDDGAQCQCNDGWSGINCHVCQNDQVCQNLLDPQRERGVNATCYSGGIPVHRMHSQCSIVNTNLKEMLNGMPAAASFTCNVDPEEPDNESNMCRFQFWLNNRESFHCIMKQCSGQAIDTGDKTNNTEVKCNQVKCDCIHGERLCGKEVIPGYVLDLQDVFDEMVKGPGVLKCKNPNGFKNGETSYNCEFDEPGLRETLGPFLGNNPVIELQCQHGECLYRTEQPGFQIPVKSVDWTMLSFIIAASTFVLFFVIYFVLRYLKKMERERLYSAQGSGFVNREEEERIRNLEREIMQGHRAPASLVFKNICYEILDPINPQKKKRILKGIYGCIKPGEMMAILGGSGAGKTSCLDILAGKQKKGFVTGQIYINGKKPTRSEFKQITGYVDQEDSLLSTLTVYETLLCSALLRLPRQMSYEMKVRRVRDVMAELGIEHIANNRIGGGSSIGSYIGGSGGSARGISGGEKRRVSIALETIPSPSLLYLDECTSGLDAYNAYSVIYNLKKLSVNYGRSIILSVHQPRSDIFSMFDKLLLLAEGGYMVYSGKISSKPSLVSVLQTENQLASEASSQIQVIPTLQNWLSEVGFPCPSHFNIADFIIDLTKMGSQLESQQHLIPNQSSSNNDSSNIDISQDSQSYHIKPNLSDLRDLQVSQNHLFKLVCGFYKSQICKDLQIEIAEVLSQDSNQNTDLADSAKITKFSPTDYSQSHENLDDDHQSSDTSPFLQQKAFGPNSLPSEPPAYREIDGEMFELQNSDEYQQQSILQRVGLNVFSSLNLGSDESKPGFWAQFKVLTWRTIINFYRNPFLMFGHYGISIILAVLCGLLFWQVKDDLSGFQNRMGVFFFLLAVLGFASISSLEVFSKERSLFVRERSAGYYGVGVYYITKILFDILPLRVIPPILMGSISYFMIGLAPGADAFFKFILVLVLFNLTAAGICLVIAVVCGNNLSLANLITVMWMLMSMLFGGFLLNKDNLDPNFRWLPLMSFFNFAFEALIVNELVDLQLDDKQVGIPIKIPGKVILKTFGFNSDNYWPDVYSLIYMFIIFVVIAFVFLQLLVKEKR